MEEVRSSRSRLSLVAVGCGLLLLGGTIPEQDIAALKKAGVAAIFGPGTPMDDIVTFIRANVKTGGAAA